MLPDSIKHGLRGKISQKFIYWKGFTRNATPKKCREAKHEKLLDRRCFRRINKQVLKNIVFEDI